MKSYAHIKRHPIHPMLIPFPIAFLLGALLFDAGSVLLHRREWAITGFHLLQLGIGAGLVAAIPGFLDYWNRVPPRSSGATRAVRHGLANVATLVLFAFALYLRREGLVTPLALALEIAGAAALTYSGWLGGVLVSRNLISVDHRTANSGKWEETRFAAESEQPIVVAHADDLKENQMKLLVVNGIRVVLARTSTGFAAFADGCTHRGGSLADGACIGNFVQCLWHGSQFDLKSGEVRCGPARKKIRVYEVRQQNQNVLLVAPRE